VQQSHHAAILGATWDTGFDHMFDRSSIRRLR
jgi:hypothetical protein